MDNEYIIKTEDLTFVYTSGTDNASESDAIPALKSIDLSIKAGEYIAVLGHNGSGKSTLAKLLNLILVPTKGSIFIDGKDVSDYDLSEDEIFEVRKKIGMVFQNPDNQIVATVVEEDVAFGVENLGLPREEIRRRVVSALNTVGMQEYAHHAPHKLSGGQKQRVAIAGIIAMKPRVIIFDESTAMLDPIGRKAVMEIMERLNREGNITIINITHYMEEAARADRVIVINDGEMILDGSAAEVFSQVDLLHRIGLESPQGVELSKLLYENGISADPMALDYNDCLNSIYNAIVKAKESN